ncbi:MAG: SDR family NAD(P)-dependent oxidoreductase, partial [Candidatus Riflebacteria bacterium]|nr:SDR family NAD(P)-dependent oxidoreductase [Candidatus Riflebacteria bacterium]
MELAGQAALVTGAGKRVGRAIALELARHGAELAIHFNRSRAQAEETVRDCEALGARAATFQADLADETAIDRMFEQ